MSDLSGITVVALEQAVAAPYASCRLAEAGARVIKLERPEGDTPDAARPYYRGNPVYETLPADVREQARRFLDNPDYPKRFRADIRLAWLKELGLKRGAVTGIRVSFHGRIAPLFHHGP